MNRQEAWDLMTQYTKSENLRKHMLAVEAAMRFYAKKFGEDEEKWAVVGLLHDFDYEQHPTPEEHPYYWRQNSARERLPRRNYPRYFVTRRLFRCCSGKQHGKISVCSG